MPAIKIQSNDQYQKALAKIDAYMDMDNLSAAQEQQYEQLVAEVERYEESEFPIEPPNPVEAIIFRMEQNGLRQKDLIPFIGSKSKVSEVPFPA